MSAAVSIRVHNQPGVVTDINARSMHVSQSIAIHCPTIRDVLNSKQTTFRFVLMKRTVSAFLAVSVAGLLIASACHAQSKKEVGRPLEFEQAGPAGEPAFPFCRNQLWGFLDRNGRVAISPKYRHTTGVQDGHALVWFKDNVSVLNTSGNILSRLPDSYLAWWAAKDRIWLQDKKTDLYALFDGSGKQILPPTFREVHSFHGGFAVVASGGNWVFPGFLENATYSYIDVQGTNAFGKTFADSAWDFHDEYAVADDVVIDLKGEIAFARPSGCDVGFSQGWIAIDHDGPPRATEYWDGKGRVALRVSFRSEGFSEGLAAFAIEVPSKEKVDNTDATWRWGYIDRTGTQVIPPRFTSAQPFKDGLAAVGIKKLKSTDRYSHDQELIGFIDRSGKIAIPPKYNDTKEFADNRCLVHQGGTQPFVYDAPTWWEGGKWLLIDKSGNELAVTELDEKR